MIRYGRAAPNTKSGIARGCIDLGSSYFRLLVAERTSGEGRMPADDGGSFRTVPGIRVLAEERAYVGWGAALSRDGLLLPDEVDGAVRALRFLVSRASKAGCDDPAIVGTNTLRRARNGRKALAALEGAVRLPIAVLSQRGEAALGFLGASTVIDDDEPAVQIDAGGTSTEIAWGRAGVMSGYVGLPWGTHAVRAATAGLDLHGAFVALRGLVFPGLRGSTEAAIYGLPGIGAAGTILCTGGTAVSLAVILNYARRKDRLFREGERISRGELELALRRMRGLVEAGRQHRLPLEKERVDLLLPGMMLLTLLVREMRLDAFSVTSRDLRWGGIIAGNDLAEYSIDGRNDR